MARMHRALQQRLPLAVGLATLIVFQAASILLPRTMSEALRDGAFDLVLTADQALRRPVASDLKVIGYDGSIADLATQVRTTLSSALSGTYATGVTPITAQQAQVWLSDLQSQLNTQVGGQYVFGGQSTAQAPLRLP